MVPNSKFCNVFLLKPGAQRSELGINCAGSKKQVSLIQVDQELMKNIKSELDLGDQKISI